MTAIMLAGDRMDTTLDARGLACPLPAVKARRALAAVPPGAALIVLATDPEAPIDVAAVAAEAGCTFAAERDGDAWRMTLRRPG
jgi:tRNA 2-thiouridine synthesizing protein A